MLLRALRGVVLRRLGLVQILAQRRDARLRLRQRRARRLEVVGDLVELARELILLGLQDNQVTP